MTLFAYYIHKRFKLLFVIVNYDIITEVFSTYKESNSELVTQIS